MALYPLLPALQPNMVAVAVLETAGPGPKTCAGTFLKIFINQIILQVVFRRNFNASKLCSIASDESFVSFLHIN